MVLTTAPPRRPTHTADNEGVTQGVWHTRRLIQVTHFSEAALCDEGGCCSLHVRILTSRRIQNVQLLLKNCENVEKARQIPKCVWTLWWLGTLFREWINNITVIYLEIIRHIISSKLTKSGKCSPLQNADWMTVMQRFIETRDQIKFDCQTNSLF